MKGQLPDLASVCSLKQSLVPATRTATANGSSVDCNAFDADMFAVQDVGTVSGTSPTLDGKIQESTDASTWSDITGATFTQVTASNNIQLIRFSRTKRYVRVVGTIAGTSPSFACGANVLGQLKIL